MCEINKNRFIFVILTMFALNIISSCRTSKHKCNDCPTFGNKKYIKKHFVDNRSFNNFLK